MGARETQPEWLSERLASCPRAPGCYLMKAADGEIVYVGKAADLKARLSQYFSPTPGDTRFFVGLLDRVLGSIELIIASNEKEALLLENQLIKQHQPRFNVKLKDDKNFLNIRIGKMGRHHAYPRLDVVRSRKKDSADYFGPYDSATALRNTLRVINRHFQLRTCRDTEFRNRTRPCLEHQIGRCPAPCVLPVPMEDYEESLQDVRMFLGGRSKALIDRLRAKMRGASAELEFELAGHYRDQMAAIERSLVPQRVRLKQETDIDAIGLFREGAKLVVQVLKLRAGTLMGSRGFQMEMELDDEEVVEDFLTAYYDGTRPLPDSVLVPVELADAEVWSELLSEARGKRVQVHRPLRGDKSKLVELAGENARETLRARLRSRDDALTTLQRLQDRLGLKNFPQRIECYDISNIQGTNPTGSMVVTIEGALAKPEYRHFKVRSLEEPNDFQMMYEVLSRRFKRGLAEGNLPDLILIDGGKGQLNIATEVMRELGIVDVDVASLAKSRVQEETAAGVPTSADPTRSRERVFRPGRKNPILLRPNSNELFLLQRLRDEAHRFAITFHKRLRAKRTLTSELDAIEGIGPARRQALLTHFGSLKRVKEASVGELAGAPGISAGLAERIAEALRI